MQLNILAKIIKIDIILTVIKRKVLDVIRISTDG
jgi:hypothetical protein